MEPQELIIMLKTQHQSLIADLSSALENSEDGLAMKTGDVISNLEKFKKDLSNHLQAEKEFFYPDYLDKKIKRGDDISKTKEFIQEMDDIAVAAMNFLDKYDSVEMIVKSYTEFRKELFGIVATLKIRIETEEEGIFDFYLMM